MPMGVSVVIPVWRDGERLAQRVREIAGLEGCTDVVVACTYAEADDLSRALAGVRGVRVVSARRGRAVQMNAGAAAASGSWLLFLHADSSLHPDALREIGAIRDPRVAGGSFRLALETDAWQAALIEWMVRRRVRLFDLPYGDQGLFVRREAFEALHGYREIPLMEDIDFVRRLRRLGPLHHSTLPVVTSARRWLRDGWTSRTLSNWLLAAQFLAGADPHRLARRYTGRRDGIIGVFTRAPGSGGKTRLWQSLGREPDGRLSAAMLADTMEVAGGVPDIDRALIVAPPFDRAGVMVPSGWDLFAQHGTDLGERLHQAFVELLGIGHRFVILVGSDVPTLPVAIPAAAARVLARSGTDLVLGPSEDGGYYLIGARAAHVELFADMPWSTPGVLAETVRRADALGLSVTLLDPWYDVDTAADLHRITLTPSATRTGEWLRHR